MVVLQGFALEDATGLSAIGDIDVQSVLAASLPRSHPSFAPQQHLEKSRRWQAPLLPDGEVDLFIGILSAGNHFAERMAVRKSWMQHKLIKSSRIVARFFVALVSNNKNSSFSFEFTLICIVTLIITVPSSYLCSMHEKK